MAHLVERLGSEVAGVMDAVWKIPTTGRRPGGRRVGLGNSSKRSAPGPEVVLLEIILYTPFDGRKGNKG